MSPESSGWTRQEGVVCCGVICIHYIFFFFQAEDGIRDLTVTGVQTCALPIWLSVRTLSRPRWKKLTARSRGALRQDVFRPALLEEAVRLTIKGLQPAPDAIEAQRNELRAELARVVAEIDRLTVAIARGGELPALLAALSARRLTVRNS